MKSYGSVILACLKIIIISNFPAARSISAWIDSGGKLAISGRGKQGSVHPADTGKV